MAGRKRKTLEQWISDRIDDKDREPAKLSAIVLFHVQGTNGRVEVHTVRVGRFATVNAKEIAAVIQDMAETHAQDLHSTQMFEVQAFYGEDRTNPARFPMAVHNTPTENGSMTTYEPTPEGRMSQRMKWEEGFLVQLWRRQEQMDQTAIRREEVYAQQNTRLQGELNDAYNLMRELFMQMRKDDHEMAMRQLQFERDTVERRKLFQIAPAVINTVMGREVLPQSTADTALLESIAEALMNSNDQDMAKVQAMASALPPVLQMTLFARLQQIAKQKNDEREEVSELAKIQAKKDIASGDEDVAGALTNGSTESAKH